MSEEKSDKAPRTPTIESHPPTHPAVLAIIEWAPRMAHDIQKKHERLVGMKEFRRKVFEAACKKAGLV